MNLRVLFLLLISLSSVCQVTETPDTISFIFAGDIMGHEPQTRSAYNPITGQYNYSEVFEKVAPILKRADFALANLEVTLAGAPYTGYPAFSSPDQLAEDCKVNGFDVLFTANNHSADKGKKGIIRTIHVLDSLGIKHTGTFKDSADRKFNNLLILQKNSIRVGLLNYTFSTNGIAVPKPTLVNFLDTLTLLRDLRESKSHRLDQLITMLHWGNEYQMKPTPNQVSIAQFLFRNGVDIIIGAHPHVLQPMELRENPATKNFNLIAYSLGNFVSNQRMKGSDGGAMIKFSLIKKNGVTMISDASYILTWVKKTFDTKTHYQILPVSIMEQSELNELDAASRAGMEFFINESRAFLKKQNIGIGEYEPKLSVLKNDN